MRIEKTYPIECSPLYRLRNKRKLAELLGVSLIDFRSLCTAGNYNVFLKKERGKERLIEHPTKQLEAVHRRIQRLFRRIESPKYLFSGKRHISSLDNARDHLGKNHTLTVDIKQFFPHCSDRYIFRFFYSQMKMSIDVARLLTAIVTYNGHIPTGSPLSMSISYWAYSKTFNALYNLAQKNKMKFSLYVDDMTFSSPQPIPRSFHTSINHQLRRVGLFLKPSKIHYHSASYHKVVTGSAISPCGSMKVPNRIRLKILNRLKECKNFETADIHLLISIHGSLMSARQIEPHFFESTYRHIKKAILIRKT